MAKRPKGAFARKYKTSAPAAKRAPPERFTGALAAQAMTTGEAINHFAHDNDKREVESHRAELTAKIKEARTAIMLCQGLNPKSGEFTGQRQLTRTVNGKNLTTAHVYDISIRAPGVGEEFNQEVTHHIGNIASYEQVLNTQAQQLAEGLIAALRSGAVVAYGRREGTTAKGSIPKEDWASDWRLGILDDVAERDGAAPIASLSFLRYETACALRNAPGAGAPSIYNWPALHVDFINRVRRSGPPKDLKTLHAWYRGKQKGPIYQRVKDEFEKEFPGAWTAIGKRGAEVTLEMAFDVFFARRKAEKPPPRRP